MTQARQPSNSDYPREKGRMVLHRDGTVTIYPGRPPETLTRTKKNCPFHPGEPVVYKYEHMEGSSTLTIRCEKCATMPGTFPITFSGKATM